MELTRDVAIWNAKILMEAAVVPFSGKLPNSKEMENIKKALAFFTNKVERLEMEVKDGETN